MRVIDRSTFTIFFFFLLKEIDSEPNDFKKKSRGLGLKSKRKDKKSDSSLFEGDHIRTSSSNPNLMHYESRTRPSSMSDAHTSGTDSFISHDQSINDIKIRERFVSKAEKGMYATDLKTDRGDNQNGDLIKDRGGNKNYLIFITISVRVQWITVLNIIIITLDIAKNNKYEN